MDTEAQIIVQTYNKETKQLEPQQYPPPSGELLPREVLYFDGNQNKWLPSKFSDNDTQISNIEKLKFLDYNLEYSTYKHEERCKEFLRHIKESEADFICFQECTEGYLNFFQSQDLIKNNYYMVTNDMTGYPHFGLMMSKYPCLAYQTDFISQQKRVMLFIELKINGKKTAVADLHLEYRFHDSDFRT